MKIKLKSKSKATNPRNVGERETRKARRKALTTNLTIEDWEELKWKWIRNKETYPFYALANLYGVSEDCIKDHSEQGGWSAQRQAFISSLKAKVQISIEEMFCRAGLPKQKLIDLITKAAVSTKKLQNVKRCYAPHEVKGRGGKTRFIKAYAIDETITVEDNTTTLQYRELVARLRGMIKEGEKGEGSGGGVPKSLVQIYLPDNGRVTPSNE